MTPIDRTEFITACHTTFTLASSPEVAEAWALESACAGMTVGGLTHHVLAQVRHAVGFLSEPPAAEAPIPLLEHYAQAAWVEAAPEDEANTSIRDEADVAAAIGPQAVLSNAEPLLPRLPDVLGAPRDPDTAHIPWQGWSLATDDFLVTRAMELVVHSDDLAASVGLPTPQFPDGLVAHVVDLLAGVAMRRHGQVAVVRALSRPQRAPASISAF
ncbi:maleylpyruvate isomerase N-terminal domain-containing protein [Aeromicrobium sp.]|uniref:maleylpyruvate isomerase N-terminal domain-containing protein n=1 Tax=Aeromicrobium sp. TaxID=1871063 RepID=UPI0030C3DCCF